MYLDKCFNLIYNFYIKMCDKYPALTTAKHKPHLKRIKSKANGS